MSKTGDPLRKIVEAFPRVTITVVGDLVADEFVFGEISRVSHHSYQDADSRRDDPLGAAAGGAGGSRA